MSLTILDRVEHAALVLDFAQPGWATCVDTDALDMAGTTTDIAALLGRPLAMEYGEDAIKTRLGLGLLVVGEETFDQLTDAWHIAINCRRP